MSKPELSIVQTLLDTGGLSTSHIGTLRFSAGSTIFKEGDDADCAYMVDSGYVEISTSAAGEKNVLAVLGDGEIFGEMALIDRQSRSATATAVHETTVVLITRQQLLEAIGNAGPLARLVLVAATKRLRMTQSTNPARTIKPDWSVNNEIRSDPYYDATRLDAAKQLRLRLALETAIKNQQFELAYQPIVTLADGRTAGFEALIRWPQPDGYAISPADFIPVAEKSGLIVPMGLWVLSQALHTLMTIDHKMGRKRDTGRGVFMSVNVSPHQLDSEENVEQLARMIEQADVNPSRVKLEITEQALLSDPRMAMLSLARLKTTGALLAIDDFGTGYSSLSYLHRFPLDTLKIDRSFVTKIADNPGGQRVVSAIIALAHELGMDVVAEGIEEIEELHWLQSHACQYGQGYFMAKPSSFATASTYLDRHFEW